MDLPSSIIQEILCFLPTEDIEYCYLVNRQFCAAVKSIFLVKGPNDKCISELSYAAHWTSSASGNFFSVEDCLIQDFQQTNEDGEFKTSILMPQEGASSVKILNDSTGEVEITMFGFFNIPCDETYPLFAFEKFDPNSSLPSYFDRKPPKRILTSSAFEFISQLLDRKMEDIIFLANNGEGMMLTNFEIAKAARSNLLGDEGTKQYFLNEAYRTFPLHFQFEMTAEVLHQRFPTIQISSNGIKYLTIFAELLCQEIFDFIPEEGQIIGLEHVQKAILSEEFLKDTFPEANWPQVSEMSSRYQRSYQVIKGRIVDSNHKGKILIETVPFQLPASNCSRTWSSIIQESHQNRMKNIEGVIFVDKEIIPDSLRVDLQSAIEEVFCGEHAVLDYHPGSNQMVRDHLHPALFVYVSGVSEFSPSNDLAVPPTLGTILGDGKDFWGRKYESSRFQWLPSYIDGDADGNWRFRNEINNLPRNEQTRELYFTLERLFRFCVPYFEAVLGYGRILAGKGNKKNLANQFMSVNEDENHEDEYDQEDKQQQQPLERKYVLKGKSLQVICKIVDYELKPGESYEGVWHVEGMSHEHIVATADYILSRDDAIVGGDLVLKRAFLRRESNQIKQQQFRTAHFQQFIENGLVPVGTVQTKDSRLIVFPNSHVHKVSKMTNEGTIEARRRIVVFFLIDPEVRIVSTQEVPRQTQVISREDAIKYRLELMQERKFHKQDWNVRAVGKYVRDINLCEH